MAARLSFDLSDHFYAGCLSDRMERRSQRDGSPGFPFVLFRAPAKALKLSAGMGLLE